MSRARHKMHKAKGGEVYYAGGESHVAHEAAEHKKGGKVKHHKKGGKACYKKGGHVKHMHAEGGKAKHHLGKHKRATGGRVGADKSPLSSAHSSTSPERD